MTVRHVVVIGGGVAGLVAARACAARGAAVTVVEASASAGGTVARQEVAGLALDAGAESFATRGGAVAAVIEDLGMGDRIVWPNAAGAWLHLADRTVPMPKGGLLGIPMDPLAPDVVAAIGADAARRAQRDLTDPPPDGFAPTTLGQLVRERMGHAVLDRLVSPVATGVYSTAADDLDVDAIAPGLRAALGRTGSLARAVQALRAASAGVATARTPGSAAGGLQGGMATLVDALAADVRARGGRIVTGTRVTGTRVTGLTRDPAAWSVQLAASAAPALRPPKPGNPPETGDDALGLGRNPLSRRDGGGGAGPADGALRADAVIVAATQPYAVRLLAAALAPALGELDWPEPTRVDLATLVLDDSRLDAAPRGTGLLVAADAHAAVAAKALTHATAKWAWLADLAGPGRHVVRLSYGQTGAGNPAASLGDDALRALAVRDASTLLGVPLDPHRVAGFARARWANAPSLAARGQRDRVRAVRDAVAAAPGLEVTGAWVAGTGLASVVPDAQDAASRLIDTGRARVQQN